MTSKICLVAVLAVSSSTSCTSGTKQDEPSAKPSGQAESARPATPAQKTVPITSKSPEAIAAFEKGRALVDHLRPMEARDLFQKAVELDPDFAMAHAYRAGTLEGAAATESLETARRLAPKVSEPERLWIEAMVLGRSGERAQALAAYRRVTEVAPDEWRAWLMVGGLSTESNNHADAVAAFTKARDANPEAAMAWNGLAYANARQRRWDEAVAAARKQTELLPTEPNPQDTLGELLLMAGKLEEAEPAFHKAITIDPKFAIAWEGIALVRAYRGDFAGAKDAAAKEKEAALSPAQRSNADLTMAWISFAEGKTAEAMKTLEAVEKEPAYADLPSGYVAAMSRAQMTYLLGKYPEAQKAWDAAQKLLATARWPGAAREQRLSPSKATLFLAAKTAKAPDAAKAYAQLEAEAKKDAADTRLQEELVLARGLVAWAKNDLKAAVSELANCPASDTSCRYELYLAKKKGGDAAGAEATAQEITPTRDPLTLWIFHQVHPKVATRTPGKQL